MFLMALFKSLVKILASDEFGLSCIPKIVLIIIQQSLEIEENGTSKTL
jgi:hypothetical protein